MGLLSFFKRSESNRASAKPVSDGPDGVQQLRLRARRRLIGATVLVAVGVIAFPLIFETQPRPLAVDLPIEIPKKDALAPLAIPPAAPPTLASNTAAAAPEAAPPSREQLAQDTSPAAAQSNASNAEELPVARSAQKLPQLQDSKPATKQEKLADKPAEKAVAKPAEKPAERATDKAADKARQTTAQRDAESARALAVLEGREPPPRNKADAPAAAASGARYIVQVGAFADAKAAQDLRAKVEKLGLKTYTQAVDTADGKRIRVRVGPFPTKEEADRAASKLHGGGLSGAVLTL